MTDTISGCSLATFATAGRAMWGWPNVIQTRLLFKTSAVMYGVSHTAAVMEQASNPPNEYPGYVCIKKKSDTYNCGYIYYIANELAYYQPGKNIIQHSQQGRG